MEDFIASNKKSLCILISIIVAFVLVVIGLVMSIDTVEPIEYGLNYSSITRTPDYSMVYTGGWYFIGPFHYFLKFPSIRQNVDFADFDGAASAPLSTTIEQSVITLSFSFQYELIKDQIPSLYQDQNMAYVSKIVTIGKSINEVGSKIDITIDSFWSNRSYVEQQMKEFLDYRLQTFAYSRCVGFQIIEISLKDTKEQSYISTQVTKQNGIQKGYEQTASNIRTQITVDTSTAQKQATIIQAQGSAQATTLTNDLLAKSKNLTITAQGESYNMVSNLTGLTVNDYLTEYIYYEKLLEESDLTLMVDIGSGKSNVMEFTGALSGKGYSF